MHTGQKTEGRGRSEGGKWKEEREKVLAAEESYLAGKGKCTACHTWAVIGRLPGQRERAHSPADNWRQTGKKKRAFSNVQKLALIYEHAECL